MKKYRRYIWLLVLAKASALSSQGLITAKTDSLIKVGIRLSIEQSFDEATAIFTALEKEMPHNPVGYFFHAASLQLKMMDYEIYEDENDFVALIDKTVELSKVRLKQSRNDPWAHFFLGSSYGYVAFHNGKQNNFGDAFRDGVRSITVLKAALEADSTLYDVCLALGIYKYYRSKLSRHFSWLPFVQDERAQAMDLLRVAIAKSRYSKYSAMNSCCWISLEEENYQEGWQVVNAALAEFPNSRVFLWSAAKLAAKLEFWDKSIQFYDKILTSLRSENALSPYNELICRKNLHNIYDRLGNEAMARQQCHLIMQIKAQSAKLSRCAKILEEMEAPCGRYSKESLLGKRGE